MPEIQRFRLPDAGEGLTEAEIVTWRVKPGDTVAINDPIVEIETAKSLVELPSPFAGVVTELLVAEGVTVDVGTPIIAVDTAPGTGPAPDARAEAPAVPEQSAVPEQPAGPVAPVADDDPTRVQEAPEEGAVEPGMIGGPASGGRTAGLGRSGPPAGPPPPPARPP